MTDDPDDDPFDMERVGGLDDNRQHGFIGRVEFHSSGFPSVDLDRRLAIDQRDDGLPVPGGRLLLHHNDIPRQNAFVPHRVSIHPQGEGIAPTDHALRNLNTFSLGEWFDRRTSGDHPRQLHMDGRQGLQRQFGHARDAAASIFGVNDRAARRARCAGKFVVSKVTKFAGLGAHE